LGVHGGGDRSGPAAPLHRGEQCKGGGEGCHRREQPDEAFRRRYCHQEPPPAGVGSWCGSVRLDGSESNPEVGPGRYGNTLRNGLSFRSTPSPSGTALPFRIPATTCSSMSTTSSPSRRPFGNPALSPPITPKRFSVSAGGTPRLSFRVSTGSGSFVCW